MRLNFLFFCLFFFIISCAKKEKSIDELEKEIINFEENNFELDKNYSKEIKLEENKNTSLKKPSYSFDSKQIQQALKKAGFYKGSIDGKIGPQTKKAIIEFQKANNLKADGIVGPRTWERLKKYLDKNE